MTDRDEKREERIEMRIIVDAYTVEEQAYGWHAYLDDTMHLDIIRYSRTRVDVCNRRRKIGSLERDPWIGLPVSELEERICETPTKLPRFNCPFEG